MLFQVPSKIHNYVCMYSLVVNCMCVGAISCSSIRVTNAVFSPSILNVPGAAEYSVSILTHHLLYMNATELISFQYQRI